MPGTPFTQHQFRRQFDRAIEDGAADRAWGLAGRLDRVSIDRALALTLLLGRRHDRRFEAVALRFLERFVAEVGPRLEQISAVADALGTLGRAGDLPAMSDGALRALGDLGRQLREGST